MLEWIDVHSHLDHLEGGVEVALNLAQSAGVKKIITIGTEPEDLQKVIDISEKYYPDVFCTLGIHPHEGIKYSSATAEFIKKHAHRKEVVAVGEIGLDYYYDQSPRKEQWFAFDDQMQIAHDVKLPVEIHTRDADADTIVMLEKYKGRVRGIIHCFTGTEELAMKALDCGYNISISGVVTFKNAQSLRDIVQKIPLDRLHVETDAPFLSPVPMRGKPNTSAYIIHTAQFLADLKGVRLEQLAEQTKVNAKKMFNKVIWD